MEQYFSNFKRYLGSGQRLSIFGREKEGKLEVFILKCSTKDEFAKKVGKYVYNSYLQKGLELGVKFNPLSEFHPEIVLVPISEGNSPQYEFKQFCKQFYKKEERSYFFFQDYLVKDNELIPIGKIKPTSYN